MELVMKKNNKLLFLVFLSFISFQTSAKILILDEFQLESEIKKKENILHHEKNKKLTTNSGKQDADDGIIHYSGDEILLLQKENIIELKGNVFVKKGLITISSEKSVIFFSKDKEPEKVETKGNVHISKEGNENTAKLEAFSDIAIFYPKEKKISFIGNAIIKRSSDTLEGDILHYNIETEEMSGKQIKGFLTSLEKTKQKESAPNARSD